MKFFTTCVVVGLASLVATDNVSDTSDYFYGLDATDVAPNSCTSAAEYFSCYRPVSAYEECNNQDPDSCSCSSALIDQTCRTKYCPNLTFDSYDVTHWCTDLATTPVSSPAKTTSASSASTTNTHSSSTGKSSSSSSGGAASVSSASSASATPAALATDSSAQATGTTSSTATAASSKPNAGGRSVVVVSVGGVAVVAVAALAVAGGFA